MSVCNHKRHRGNDEPDAPLLLDGEPDACGEGDVVIGGEQGDQGNDDASDGLDPALRIEAARAAGRKRNIRQFWRRFRSGLDRHRSLEASTYLE
ncbi:MAG: hypothetical protein ACKO28_01855 [Cyanobium sp.]